MGGQRLGRIQGAGFELYVGLEELTAGSVLEALQRIACGRHARASSQAFVTVTIAPLTRPPFHVRAPETARPPANATDSLEEVIPMLGDPEFQKDLVKIVIQYGLFAIFVTCIAALFSRSLERFKSGLSWGSEMLKQRLAVALEIDASLHDLVATHRQAVGNRYLSNFLDPEDFKNFRSAEARVLTMLSRAALLFPEQVVAPVGHARNVAMASVVKCSPDTMGNCSPVIDAQGMLKAELNALEDAVTAALGKVRSHFPTAFVFGHATSKVS